MLRATTGIALVSLATSAVSLGQTIMASGDTRNALVGVVCHTPRTRLATHDDHDHHPPIQSRSSTRAANAAAAIETFVGEIGGRPTQRPS